MPAWIRQSWFTYGACGTFTKHQERIQKFRKTGSLKHLHRSELDKACFTHDAAYSDSKDLANRTISDKFFEGRAYEIARNPKYDGYQRGLASMDYEFFYKKTGLGVGADVSEEVAQELHKAVITKFKRRRAYARFKDNIWAVDLIERDHYLLRIKVLNIYYVL